MYVPILHCWVLILAGAFYPANKQGKPLTYVAQLVKAVAGWEKCSWRNIFMANESKTCWTVIKEEVEQQGMV